MIRANQWTDTKRKQRAAKTRRREDSREGNRGNQNSETRMANQTRMTNARMETGYGVRAPPEPNAQ
jgi:hypothetical protein